MARSTEQRPGWLTRRLERWARRYMERRPPDFVIGDDYLLRWYVIPRNRLCNIYLHCVQKSDEDRALHDHPWASFSWILSGTYREHMPHGTRLMTPGRRAFRRSSAPHRLEAVDAPVISLFLTGPKVREWGFHCPQGWRHWRRFTDSNNSGRVGRGCD
ncbi:hypothetical protein [Thioalkalivibrio sp. ALE19]|uniref:hypothetical protein n=1 Tax=Thioalkalivibrio sp. ALE19 TaxID=1266909 RepID=UPI0003FCFBF5|nr:hypothetical protein [Thioalkalivibrio sp. ALE19]